MELISYGIRRPPWIFNKTSGTLQASSVTAGYKFRLWVSIILWGEKKSHCGRLNCQFLLIRNVNSETSKVFWLSLTWTGIHEICIGSWASNSLAFISMLYIMVMIGISSWPWCSFWGFCCCKACYVSMSVSLYSICSVLSPTGPQLSLLIG